MSVRELTATLAIPIDVDFHNSAGNFLCSARSNQGMFQYFNVIRWWPESQNKIVVFIDERVSH